MKLTWLGHSCFALESNGYKIITDPYEGVRGLKDTDAEANSVYCSHYHFDHAFLDGVKIIPGGDDPFKITDIECFHDDANGLLRGRNTIRVFEAEGLSVVHMGDLGHRLSPARVLVLKGCDVLLMPVGGTYTVSPQLAKEICDAIEPGVIIPMHYREGNKGFEELCTVDEFSSLYPAEFVRHYDCSNLDIREGMARQVAVLKMP